MRQETNNEMDLLLRRLGRRQDTPASSDHLDADELSSYAENALPPAARARYTEHLAECTRCRDLVVQLSSSAGVVVATETAKVPALSGLRKFLASLFSPMVLRYAVPAMGVVIVAAIGFVVTRNEGSLSPVAENRETRQLAQPPAPASQPQPSSADSDSRGRMDTKSMNKSESKEETAAAAGAAAPPPPNAPPVVSAVTVEVQDSANKIEQQQEDAKAGPPAPKPTPTVSELSRFEPQAAKQATGRDVVVANEAPPAEKTKTQDRSDAEVAAASPGAARGRSEPRRIASLQSDGVTESKRESDKDKNDADIRNVAGRRFRKQGNIWVDTAYSSARNTTDLTRGSEGYRALVADEPSIKQIADTLDGEIIVVWKGRAYRIR